jgi:hypothetical protein
MKKKIRILWKTVKLDIVGITNRGNLKETIKCRLNKK